MEFKNSNIRNVIAEYIKLLDAQRSILNCFYLGSKDEDIFLAQPYNFYSGTEAVTQVRNLRLHDLVLKQIHDRISNVLKKAVDERGIHVNRCISEFSNSTGITTIEIGFVDNKFQMGLQLQGNQLRYYTLLADENINREMANTFFQRMIWFVDLDTKVALLGKGRSPKDLEHKGMIHQSANARRFCKFGSNFLYLYKKCNFEGELSTIGEVVNLIVRSLEHLKNVEHEIVDVYNGIVRVEVEGINKRVLP
jgi:hypothetical protein